MRKTQYLLVALVGLALAVGLSVYWWYGESAEQVISLSRAPQSNNESPQIIANKVYNATNGAEQVIVVGRGATTPQTNNLSETQIANYTYDATNGARQVIVSSNSSDIPFINTTSLTDGDLLYYDSTGAEWLNTQGNIGIGAGTAASPDLMFGDGDTGFYEVVDDVVYFSVAGTARIQMGSTFGGITARSPVIWDNAGSASYASLFFAGDGNTGIYSPAADQVAVTTGGTQRILVDTTGEVEFSFGIVPVSKTADPCGSGFPTGSIFYNSTANTWCGCDGTNDVKLVDGSACF